MKAFNFYKDDELKEVDIIIDTPVSYEDGKKDMVMVKVGGITLPVLSINNLIKMKKNTGRGIDKVDIEELEKIKLLRKKL